MGRIMLWSRDHAVAVMLFFAVVTGCFAYKIKDIRLDASSNRLMVPGTPEVEFYEKTKATFGSDNITVIYIKDKNLFTYEKLKAIEEVFYKIQDVKGVSRADSIFNAKNFKNEKGSLQTSPLLDPIPEDPALLEQVKKDALANPLLVNNLIKQDGAGITINVTADAKAGAADPNFNNKLADEIDKLIEPLKPKVEQVWQVGTPMTHRLITQSLLGDQATLIPLSVVILLAMILLCLKTIHGAIVPLIGGGISVVWTMGTMAIFGIPIQILTVIVPSIVLVIGSAEDMHLIAEYFEGLEHGNNRRGALDHIAKQLGLAVFFTALTTIVGFSTVAINDMILLQEFGYMAAFGISVSFLVTLLFNPAYLILFGEKTSPFARKAGQKEAQKYGWFERLADLALHLVEHHKAPTLALCAVIVMGSIWGATYIRVDNDLLGNFKPGSEIRVKSQKLHEEIAGAQNFFIVLESPKEATFKKAEGLRLVFAIQKYIEEKKVFDSSLSVANQIAFINREMFDGNKSKYAIPEKDDLISQYLLMLSKEDIERYVTSDFKQASIVVRHNLSSSYDLKRSLNDLKAEITRLTEGMNIKFQFTSESILVNEAADSISSGQTTSLLLTLSIIFALMSVLFVNLKAGFLSLIPSIIPIFILFGVMGIAGIPLNPGTSMVADIAIGIAVDNTTHLMVRYHNHAKENPSQTPWEAIVSTVRSEVRPMMTTTIALSLAFLSLMASTFMPLVHFGFLAAMVLVIGIFADLIVTPVLLSTMSIVTLGEMVTLRLREKVIKSSPLFKGLKPWQIKKVVVLGHVKTCKKGEIIIQQGANERSMYLILNGLVKTERLTHDGTSQATGDFFIGEVFGEVGMVSEVVRTESAIAALDNTELLLIDWNSLEAVRKSSPQISNKLFANISRILGNRLALTVHAQTLQAGAAATARKAG